MDYDKAEITSEITISEMDNAVDSLSELKKQVSFLQGEIDAKNYQIREIEEKLMSYLEYFGKDKYVAKNCTIDIREHTSVRIPATEEQKEEFFNYLRSQSEDLYRRMATVNSRSLNSYYKQELDIARDEGRELSIPGLDPHKIYKKIYIRSNK